MPDLHGVFRYDGMKSFLAGSYTCSHGITPGVVTLTLADEADVPNLADVGSVTIEDGLRSVTLKNCKLVSVTRQVGSAIEYLVQLYDRRWVWRQGSISGRYNVRDVSGKIDPLTRKGPRALAALLLDAMGEVGYDLTALPIEVVDEAMPEVDWDYTNPSEALADLCDLFKLRVVYQPTFDMVKICKPGVGAAMLGRPDFTAFTPTFTRPIKPRSLLAVGAPAAFMIAVRLEAVGLDLDGTIKPIDDLSYKPDAGWGKICASSAHRDTRLQLTPEFANRLKTQEDVVAAAQRSLYRWYRVTADPVLGPTFTIPGMDDFAAGVENAADVPTVTDAYQLVPLPSVVEPARDDEARLQVRPAAVFGIHDPGTGHQINTAASERVKAKFTIDSERGLVAFEKPVYASNPTNAAVDFEAPGTANVTIQAKEWAPAILVLATSFYIRDVDTHAKLRFTKWFPVDLNGIGAEQIVKADQITFAAAFDYNPGEWKPLDIRTNRKECEEAADYYLLAANDFDDREQRTKKFPILAEVSPDGAIQQVTWEAGGGPCSTTISRNTEHATYLPKYQFRRSLERNRKLASQLGGGIVLALMPEVANGQGG